ncbi:glycosyltransferase family 2 protein [Thalassospira marina]|uniref:Glycosyltransferase 2-like domain-containing protein n=1 Tax=Thalassospira marina TaxID=2048283 RepID=A0A2N3KVT9_9PROT|nr:glycosyltransferase [Thalassospira marina]PKR54583.1 hypothetical protein COO20_07425 [Thalassospira marina]
MMKATIGITCHNAEKTIARALKSVQNQTFSDIEILVLDDGSCDNSVAIVSEIEKQDRRIRLIKHKKNLGTSAARSRLVFEAQGEFLAFLDDDDEIFPERLKRQINTIIESEEKYKTNLIACYSSRNVVSGEKEEYMSAIGGSNGNAPHGPMVALNILTGYKEPGYIFGPVGSGTLMARRETFITVGDFDSNLRRTEDLDWAIRLSLMGGIFVGCSEPLIRQHVTTSQEKDSIKPLLNNFQLLQKYKKFLMTEKRYVSSFIFHAAKFFYAKKKKFRYKILLAILYAFDKELFKNIKRG